MLEGRILNLDNRHYVVAEWNGTNHSGYRPLDDKVLVLMDAHADTTAGGIAIPEQIAERQSMAAETGLVVALGPAAFRWNDDGTRAWDGERPEPGSRVYVSRYADELPHPIVQRLEDVIGAVNDWSKLPDRAMPEVALEADDDCTILYTSGTTGKPKGALGTHRNMIANIFAAACVGARNFLRRGEAPPELDPFTAPQRAALLSVPFFHATGCFAILNPSLISGGKLVGAIGASGGTGEQDGKVAEAGGAALT